MITVDDVKKANVKPIIEDEYFRKDVAKGKAPKVKKESLETIRRK